EPKAADCATPSSEDSLDRIRVSCWKLENRPFACPEGPDLSAGPVQTKLKFYLYIHPAGASRSACSPSKPLQTVQIELRSGSYGSAGFLARTAGGCRRGMPGLELRSAQSTALRPGQRKRSGGS